MNGWLRLWVFLTAIWAVFVVGIIPAPTYITCILHIEKGPWLTYSLSKNSRSYFQNLNPDEKGPSYTVELLKKDGTKDRIRFQFLEKNELKEFSEKMSSLVNDGRINVSVAEITKFITKQSSLNNSFLLTDYFPCLLIIIIKHLLTL